MTSPPSKTTVSSSLLYLAVDLGPSPTMARFGREVAAVNTLWWHCVRLATFSRTPQYGRAVAARLAPKFVVVDPEQYPEPPVYELVVRRTQLASPWVTTLTTVAERYAPVGYGVAALWGLQRLMNMVMEWQRHRLDMQLGTRMLARGARDLVDRHAAEELTTHAIDPGGSRVESIDYEGTAVSDAVRTFSPVLEARMVNESDDSGG